MRGNNKRKLVARSLLEELLPLYKSGVPLAKLVRDHNLDVTPQHLRKLLFIYIEILKQDLDADYRTGLQAAYFPDWLTNGIMVQPDNWTYDGKFPVGTWEKKDR